ncbi:MAG: phosphotransferase family protein, partial [Terriglobia bacterium]
LRIDPYYRTTAGRRPDVAPAIRDLMQDSWQIRASLVHGDYSPKNILVQEGRIFLIDFEVVHWGDPAFDSGFLLNHLLLKAIYRPQFASLYLDAAGKFWNALVNGMRSADDAGFELMTVRHLGALMLARIDGKSPVEYIESEETKERVRRVAKRILLERPQHLHATFEWVVDASRA